VDAKLQIPDEIAQRLVFYFVDLGEKRFFEFGNWSHIPHDFAFFFISHFIPGKQHNRRFPEASMSHAFSIRRLRVSGCLAELIEKIQSRRASGVMSSHPAFASGAAARALRRSIGTLISGSSPARVISTVTAPAASAPAASHMVLLTLSQWLPLPFGSRADRKGKLLIVPSTIVLPRDGSFALAFLGRVRVHDPVFSFALGRNNLALKRIVDLVSCCLASFIRDFPYAFLPRISLGLFYDFLPAPQVCKPFYPSRPRVFSGETRIEATPVLSSIWEKHTLTAKNKFSKLPRITLLVSSWRVIPILELTLNLGLIPCPQWHAFIYCQLITTKLPWVERFWSAHGERTWTSPLSSVAGAGTNAPWHPCMPPT
jgi:hypothetical protein